MVVYMGLNDGHHLRRSRPARPVRLVGAAVGIRRGSLAGADGVVVDGGTNEPSAVAGLEGAAPQEVVSDLEIEQAVNAWQVWEDAINRAGQMGTPAWMQVNGRRWAEPGE